ncbi:MULTISPECIES: GNAT family N-acetyltransferase [Sphingomonas]|uniref:GNAT family N-acetyltransferase n=1 Tax=Sphingomonas TaxID=13687 RepID=UPI000829B785|nr:GNAT family N-acetyltransferase [Sphingomonas sp. CCH10-B3]
MTGWRIIEDDLTGDAIRALMTFHVQAAHANTPAAHAFALGVEALRAPGITLWSLWEAGALLGCAALKDLGQGEGELKSMRTAPDQLRRGVAAALLDHAIAEARRRGWHRLNLETGTDASFAPAWALYRRFGFSDCGPYADYVESDHNRFMTLALNLERKG